MEIDDIIREYSSYLLCQKCVSINTHKAYVNDVTIFLRRTNKDIEQLGRDDIVESLKKRYEDSVSAKSVARFIASLRSLFSYLALQKGVKHAEVLKTFLTNPKLPYPLPRYCSEDDIRKLIDFFTINIPTEKMVQKKLIIYLLYSLGLRVSELINLKRKDFNFDDDVVRIEGKRGRIRMIPFDEYLKSIIYEYINICGQQSKWLFFSPKDIGMQMCRQTIWKLVKKIGIEAGVGEGLFPHIFRHSIATHCLKQGWDIRSIQEFLGHERITTAEIYTHVDESHLQKIYKKNHPRS